MNKQIEDEPKTKKLCLIILYALQICSALALGTTFLIWYKNQNEIQKVWDELKQGFDENLDPSEKISLKLLMGDSYEAFINQQFYDNFFQTAIGFKV